MWKNIEKFLKENCYGRFTEALVFWLLFVIPPIPYAVVLFKTSIDVIVTKMYSQLFVLMFFFSSGIYGSYTHYVVYDYALFFEQP